MTNDYSALWDECKAMIAQHVTPSQYISFFEPINFERFEMKSRTLSLQVPSKILVEYLEVHFIDILRKVLNASFGQGTKLNYHVLEANKQEVEVDIPQIDSNLNPHYSFSTFIEGKSNMLARSIGFTISQHPRSTKFNPMFVYGPSGCGKTHLINAIGLQTRALYPKKKVLYVGAREFQRQYTEAVLNKTPNDFILFYQQFDMLIVDDVQEWESSPKSSETFFHIFNHLFLNGRRIVLAADRTPAELHNMSDRLITRFSCGVLAELEKPNLQLCIDILKAKIARDGVVIPDDVVEYIAANANGSVRDLEGVVNSLLAFSMVYNNDIDMSLAEKVVKRITKDTPKKYDVNHILDVVCGHFNVPIEDVLGKSRKRELVNARQIVMHFSQSLAKVSVNRIGRLVGGRDHSTVLHSCRLVADKILADRDFAREMKQLEKKIKARH